MTNQRDKGARGERYFATKLRPYFPDVQRNWQGQAAYGGSDLTNTDPFSFEIKYGKMYTSKMISKIIKQTIDESIEGNIPVAIVKPHKEKPYVIIPFDEFLKLIDV